MVLLLFPFWPVSSAEVCKRPEEMLPNCFYGRTHRADRGKAFWNRRPSGLTTNMIANMGKEQNISMNTLARICEALDCQITDVIALAPGDPPTIGGKHDKESNKTDS